MNLLPILAAAAIPVAETTAETEPAAHFEMVVVGNRSGQSLDETTAAAEVIDRRAIEASGTRDVAELLAERADIDVRSTQFGASVGLQGLDPDHVLVLVDGQRMAGRQGGVVDLSRIPTDSVARIEILRGPSSALYGSDAMGGVINVVTRRAGRPLEVEGELRYGERNLLEASGSAATRGEVGLARVTFGLRRSDAWRFDPDDVATVGSALDEKHLLLRGEVELSDELRVDATGSWSLRDVSGVDTGAGGAVYDRVERQESAGVSLRPELSLSRQSRLRLSLEGNWFGSQFLQDQRGSSALDRIDEVRERLWNVGLQLDARIGAHLLVAGTEVLVEEMDSERLRESRTSRNRIGIYAQDEWRIAERWRLSPGMRLELQEDRDPIPSPRIGARFDPTDTVILRASYGWAFRAPSFQEMLLRFENPSVGYVVDGNPDLEPETSRGVNAGLEWMPLRSVRASVNFFRHEIDDLIAVATIREAAPGVPRGFGYVNVDRAISQGVESTVRFRPLRELELTASWAFTDARNRDTDERLEGRAKDRISGVATWRIPSTGSEISARVSWIGPRPFPSEAGTEFAPAHLQLAAHLRQAVTDEIALVAGGTNLLDEGNLDFLPLAPRTFYGGVSFHD